MLLRTAWEDSRIPRVGGECAESAVGIGIGVDALKFRLNQETWFYSLWGLDSCCNGRGTVDDHGRERPGQRSSTRIRGAVVDDKCGRVGREDL